MTLTPQRFPPSRFLFMVVGGAHARGSPHAWISFRGAFLPDAEGARGGVSRRSAAMRIF